MIEGHQGDPDGLVIEPFVVGLYAPLYELVSVRDVRSSASGTDDRGQRHAYVLLPEVLVYLPLPRGGFLGYRGTDGILVVLVRHGPEGLLHILGPEDTIAWALVGHSDVDLLLPAIRHEPLVQKDPVGIDGVPVPHGVLPEVLLLKSHDLLVKRHGQRKGFSAVPDEPCGLILLGCHPDELLHPFDGDLALDPLFGRVITMLAIDVAEERGFDNDGDMRLHDRMIPSRTMHRDGIMCGDQNGQNVQAPKNPSVA